jgi:hypothetical protein|tara:strand:- start:52 stop:657 length:606 start_codon:yes stop_codon:yes gene_type:complete
MQLNKFELDKDTLIGGWFMPESIIDDIHEYWNSPEAEEYKHAGFSSDGFSRDEQIHSTSKTSIDVGISPQNYNKPWSNYRKYLQKCLESYLETYPDANNVQPFDITRFYNIQWYPKGGGYYAWHAEISGHSWNIYRHLVFMTYCDDVPDAGTHFKHQDLTVPCKKGLTIIWPASFTHTHKGQITDVHEKMIVTGWYNFIEA